MPPSAFVGEGKMKNAADTTGGDPWSGETDREIRKREFAFRVFFTLGFLLLAHLERLDINLGGKIDYPLLYVLGGIYLIYSLATFRFYRLLSLRGRLRWLVAVLDITAICLAIFLCGGVESYTFLFLGLAALIGGVYGELRGAVYASILALAGYTAIAILDRRLPPGYDLYQALALRYGYIVGASLLDTYVTDVLLKDRRRLRIFYEISQSSSRSPALYNVIDEIAHRMAEITRAEIAVLFTHDENAGTLVAQQPSPGLDFHATSDLKVPLRTGGLLSGAFEEGKPLLLTRRACRELELPVLLPEIRILDLLVHPLEARGKKIGLLVLANKLSRRGFGRHDLELVGLLAPHISVFLDNALLFRKSEEKVAQLTSLIRVVDTIHTTSSLDQLYNLTMDVIRGLFAPDKALINLVEDSSGMLKMVRNLGYTQEYAEKHLSRPFSPMADCYVIKSGDSFLCPDVESEGRCPNMMVGEGIRSVLCVPIRSGTTLYGILHMASRFKDAFDEEDAALAKAIGEQLGMAVERTRLFEEISQLAITDELTGLYNVRHLKRVLGEEVKRSLRYQRSFSFIMLDIDNFKEYNDQHGHLRGDEVLRTLAGILRQNIREVDTAFRYGGEEFSVIIPEVPKQEAHTLAERIRRVVQDHVFPFEELQPGGNLTVSMGISGFPEDAEDTEGLIDCADRALYRAKLTGRNRVCLYDPSMDKEAFRPHVPL